MNNDSGSINSNAKKHEDEKQENKKEEQTLPVHNPFDPNDDRKITQEELDNEQKFKEALSERD